MTTIACGMATIPSRYAHAEKTVRQFLADERVTSFTLYCDSHEVVPMWWVQFDDERLKLLTVCPDDPLLGDVGKLGCIEQDADVYLLLDDDLDYPEDYADAMLAECSEEYRIVSAHGVTFGAAWEDEKLANPTSPYAHREVAHFNKGVGTIAATVDLGGTGVMAVHKSARYVLQYASSFPHSNMLDIVVAVQAARQGINIWQVPHEADWIKQGVIDEGTFERREEDPIKNELSIAMIKYLLKLRRER